MLRCNKERGLEANVVHLSMIDDQTYESIPLYYFYCVHIYCERCTFFEVTTAKGKPIF
jgi:hypothetical protein